MCLKDRTAGETLSGFSPAKPAHRLPFHARPRLGPGLSRVAHSSPIISTVRWFTWPSATWRSLSLSRARHSPRSRPTKSDMGWKFKWVSSFADDFNRDFHVSVHARGKGTRQGRIQLHDDGISERRRPGLSALHQERSRRGAAHLLILRARARYSGRHLQFPRYLRRRAATKALAVDHGLGPPARRIPKSRRQRPAAAV